MKKRPTLLLEILLGFTILALCIGPLMRQPIELYRTQMKALKEMEKDRLADFSFAEVKIDLLNCRIAWNKLPSKETPRIVLSLPDAYLQIPYCEKTPIARRAVLQFKKEKMSIKGELVRLIGVEIQFAPFDKKEDPPAPAYIYQTVVRKISPVAPG